MKNETPNESINLPEPEANSQPRTTGKLLGMKVMPGWAWNPLLTLPRNQPCPCRSGLKFKTCCLRKLPKVVTIQDAEIFKAQMLKPDLVFITKENEAKIAAEANAALQANCAAGHDWEFREIEGLGRRLCKRCGTEYNASVH